MPRKYRISLRFCSEPLPMIGDTRNVPSSSIVRSAAVWTHY
jgi:hypothetical protein